MNHSTPWQFPIEIYFAMRLLYVLFTFSIIIACVPPPENAAIVAKQFRTTAPSALYFKNIRSINYSMQEDAKTRIEYYQLKKAELSKTRVQLLPRIANDWLNDGAYIQLELLNTPKENASLIIGEQQLKLEITASLEAQTTLALQIETALKERTTINLQVVNEPMQVLFEDEKERGNFLVVLQDYLRLTENDR